MFPFTLYCVSLSNCEIRTIRYETKDVRLSKHHKVDVSPIT